MPQPAELIWTRYDKEQESKNYLLLYLGEHGTGTIALIADEVPDTEIKILRVNLPQIRSMIPQQIGEFIKKNMPVSYRNAYRHFNTQKLSIIRSYGIKELKTTEEQKKEQEEDPTKLAPEA